MLCAEVSLVGTLTPFSETYANFRPVQLDFGSLKSTLSGDIPARFLAPLVHRHLAKTSEVWLAEVLTAQVEFLVIKWPCFRLTKTDQFRLAAEYPWAAMRATTSNLATLFW